MYVFKIDPKQRTIVIDDYQDMVQYYFHEGKNPYEHEISLMFNKYDFDDVDLLDPKEPGVKTTNNEKIFNCDIKDFDVFSKYLENL